MNETRMIFGTEQIGNGIAMPHISFPLFRNTRTAKRSGRNTGYGNPIDEIAKLSRVDLLEMLIDATRETQRLREENTRLQAEIERCEAELNKTETLEDVVNRLSEIINRS